MAKIVTVNTPWQYLTSSTTAGSGLIHPATDYRRAGPVRKIRGRVEVRNLTVTASNSMMVSAAYNLTNQTLAPNDTGFAVGSFSASSSSVSGALTLPSTFTDVSGDTDAFQLLRLGFMTKNGGSNGTLMTGEARAQFDLLVADDIQAVSAPYNLIYADSTTAAFFPATPWYNSVRCTFARGVFELRALQSPIQVSWGYQITDNPASPGATGTAIGAASASPGVTYPTGWTTIDPTAGQLIRFGWLASRTSTTGFVAGMAGGEIEFGTEG